MPNIDTSGMTIPEMLRTSIAITEEFRRRGCVRTGTSLAGELMERVVADAYGGDLEAPANAGWDLALPDGRRVQVKARFIAPDVVRPYSFSNLDFDVAVLVWVDADTFEISWAREASRVELEPLLTEHASASHRLTKARARSVGRDVTAPLREALAALA